MQEYAPDPYGDGDPEQRYDGANGVGASAAAADLIERQPSKTFGRPPPGVPPPIGYSQEDSESNPVYMRMANAWGIGNVEFDPDTGSWVTVSKSKPKKGAAAYPAGIMPGMPAMPYGMYGAPMMPPYPGMMPGMYPGAMPPMYGGMVPPGPSVPPVAETMSKQDMKRQAKKEMKKLLRKEQEEEERRAEKEARRRRKKEDRQDEKSRREEERRKEEIAEFKAAREAAEADARERANLDQERVTAQQAALKRQEHEAKMRNKQLAHEREVEARQLAKEREDKERQIQEERERARQRALRGVEEAARLGAHTPTSSRNSWLSESSHVPPYTPYEDRRQEPSGLDAHSQRSYGSSESRSDGWSDKGRGRASSSSSSYSHRSNPPVYRSTPSSRSNSGDRYTDRSASGGRVDDGADSQSIRSTSSSRRGIAAKQTSHTETHQPPFHYHRERAVSSSHRDASLGGEDHDSRSLRSTRSGRGRTESGTSTSHSRSDRSKTPHGSLRSDSSRLPSYPRAGQSYTYGSSPGRSVESDTALSYSSSRSARSNKQSTSRNDPMRSKRDEQEDDIGDWDFGGADDSHDTSETSSKGSSLPYKMERLTVTKSVPTKTQATGPPSLVDDDDEEAIYVRNDGRSRSMTSSIPSSYRRLNDGFDDTRSIKSGRSANSYLSARPPTSRRWT